MTVEQLKSLLLSKLEQQPNEETLRQWDYLLQKFSQENQYTKVLREKGMAMRNAQHRYFQAKGFTPAKEQLLKQSKQLEQEFDQQLRQEPKQAEANQKTLFS